MQGLFTRDDCQGLIDFLEICLRTCFHEIAARWGADSQSTTTLVVRTLLISLCNCENLMSILNVLFSNRDLHCILGETWS
jgi:hypothetical protein